MTNVPKTCLLYTSKPVCTRYVKMQGLKQATMWGYSLYEFELYGRKNKPTDLTPVHFIKLELNDENGQLLSDNFYWRSNKPGDYKACLLYTSTRNGEQPVIYEQSVHRFILLQADITCIGLLDLGIYRFE